jgi:hypothetical protein
MYRNSLQYRKLKIYITGFPPNKCKISVISNFHFPLDFTRIQKYLCNNKVNVSILKEDIMAPIIRMPDCVYNRLTKHSRGIEEPAEVIERLLDHYEGVDPTPKQESESDGFVTDMSRIEFVLSVGCAHCNWNQSWSFVNHDEEFILFDAWGNLENENGQLILSEDWRYSANGQESEGFIRAIKHIDLIEIAGYQLKTFHMPVSNDGEENVQIKPIQPRMFDKKLKRIGKDWFAVD